MNTTNQYRDPLEHLSMLAGHLLVITTGSKKNATNILTSILDAKNQSDLKQKLREQGIDIQGRKAFSKDFFRDISIYCRRIHQRRKEQDIQDVIEKEYVAYLERNEIEQAEPENVALLQKNILS
jgi:hypothetical protein